MPWYGYVGIALGWLLAAGLLALLIGRLLGGHRDDAARAPGGGDSRMVPLRGAAEVVVIDVKHNHTWSGIAHLDGCHAYSWHYTCPCGAARSVGGERDFSADGMSTAMWFEESCERCRELLEGAKPQSWDETIEANA